MIVMKFSGKQYNGSDPETGNMVRVVGGQKVEVSETKSEQLLKDYPKFWEVVGDSVVVKNVLHEDDPVEELDEEDPIELESKKPKKKKMLKVKRKK